MNEPEVDELDQKILQQLQLDARNLTSGEIAERADAADSTVRKRIQKLEEQSIIKGYTAEVDYERSGYPLRMILFCTAPIPKRGSLVSEILDMEGVITVQELVTGEENLLVTVIGKRDREITTVAEKLLDKELEITDEVLVRRHESSPFERFSKSNQTNS
jgi:DNA-binding Lrp family transcriptional regulator